MKIAMAINCILIFALAFGSFQLGLYINSQGKDTMDFCYNSIRNESFIKTMDTKTWGADPSVPIQCVDSIKNPYPFSEEINSCLANSSESQLRYMHECHWMGKDYFILAGTLLFGFFLPAMFWIMIGAMLKEEI